MNNQTLAQALRSNPNGLLNGLFNRLRKGLLNVLGLEIHKLRPKKQTHLEEQSLLTPMSYARIHRRLDRTLELNPRPAPTPKHILAQRPTLTPQNNKKERIEALQQQQTLNLQQNIRNEIAGQPRILGAHTAEGSARANEFNFIIPEHYGPTTQAGTHLGGRIPDGPTWASQRATDGSSTTGANFSGATDALATPDRGNFGGELNIGPKETNKQLFNFFKSQSTQKHFQELNFQNLDADAVRIEQGNDAPGHSTPNPAPSCKKVRVPH